MKLVKNALGRLVPTEINGREAVPYMGVGKFKPTGRKYAPPIRSASDYPADGNKIVPDLATALKNAGLKDGMTISSHHHLRNGDMVANEVFGAAAAMGAKDLMWFPSASFPCHKGMIEHMENGVINRIEGSMNGPLGAYCSEGKMSGMGVLRSHGGRWQAIQDGDVHIDI
ncbi:citrate lyase subunit alpha, partial [bacterium]|nr:citrate lyase subunit alpha [bacterium]